jgi:hypothetical protein
VADKTSKARTGTAQQRSCSYVIQVEEQSVGDSDGFTKPNDTKFSSADFKPSHQNHDSLYPCPDFLIDEYSKFRVATY